MPLAQTFHKPGLHGPADFPGRVRRNEGHPGAARVAGFIAVGLAVVSGPDKSKWGREKLKVCKKFVESWQDSG